MADDSTIETTLYKPSFVLIAIDTGPSMFVKGENSETTFFKDCISACYELVDSLLFTQNKRSWSPFGMVLALEDTTASFVDFNNNILETIKFLKAKNELQDDELRSLYQRKGSLDLSAFFLFCKKKFKEIKSAFYKRTIIYITNDDNPTRNDKVQTFAALNEAKNFAANDIHFEIVTMNTNFDYKIFYNELYSVIKAPLVETFVEDKDGLIEKLSSLIIFRYFQRRLLFYPFKNDPARFLRVFQKKYVSEEKLFNNAFISRESGKEVKKLSKNSQDALKVHKLNYTMGTLEFDTEEHFNITNNNLQAGYTLIHVSDRVTDVGFVFSDSKILELDYKEELPYFNSFWQYCVDKNKVLICARKLRQQDKIRFVEFIPKFMNNTKVFLIKTIPFIEEQKPLPSSLAEISYDTGYSENKIKLANNIIDSLSFDYDPKMFVNTSLSKKKAFLKGKLLDQSQEDVEDISLDKHAIDDRLSGVAEEFKQLFDLDEEVVTKKRRAPAAKGVSKKKK